MSEQRVPGSTPSPTHVGPTEATSTAGKKLTSLEDLQAMAKTLRRHIIEMTSAAASGHPGGSLSSVEIVTALYFSAMRYKPEELDWPDRDRFILSKGHAAPLLYSVLAEVGCLSTEESVL